MDTIVIVDVGLGNLRSVQRAVERAAADAGRAVAARISGDADAIARADRLVFPGQGAFRDCATALEGGLAEALRARIAAGAPYLGICLGLQALFASSEEAPGRTGLGVLAGRVVRLPDGAVEPGTGAAVKIPHMGWNQVRVAEGAPAALAAADGRWFYFVHSFHAVPEDASCVVATAQHGPHVVTAAVARDNVLATQFHPEKSQEAGLALLARLLSS